jgi:hypothetical protein
LGREVNVAETVKNTSDMFKLRENE